MTVIQRDQIQSEFDTLEIKIKEYLRTCSRACIGGAKLAKMSARSNELRAALAGADLTGADLTGASLRGADLTDADLTGADLTGADLRGADLTGAQS
jgi:uncharacterized protein YjbI with pentapeptide repeats